MNLLRFFLRQRLVLPVVLPLALLSSCAEMPRFSPSTETTATAATQTDRPDEATLIRLLRDTPQTAGPASQNLTARLLTLGKRRSPAEQLQLAMLLLARGDAGDAELAQNLLEGLRARADDVPTRHFIALLQRDCAQQLALQQAQKNVQTLQKQIDQIKSLETQLQNRSH
ncbi:MAG: hypothetical protein RBR52_09065 [Thiomonas sp.]|uniref:hypothetical protein n=1 Tax=Thiomonas sp. TaxID=2047785 RepID=UPI002A35BE51|nr:hypothetical protein [Thiomonas sp.]MDY0330630.1 hypothetical protein [Thiomonas sp.]